MFDTTSAGDRLADLWASPLVALALLETLRSTDTPAELLEDEDVQRSLPRRLGLSDAVDAQIRRYRELLAHSGSLPAREVGDLFALVSRRPDALSVFERAGSWLVHQRMESGGLTGRLASIPLPRALRERLALRVARQVGGDVNPTAQTVRVERGPVTLVVEKSLPAACAAPDACRILLGALRASLAAYSVEADKGEADIAHPRCELRGDRCCLWRPAD